MSIITISRGTMSGGEKLANMLCEKLGYKCISREIIIKAADDYGVEEHKLFEAINKSPSILRKLTFEKERYLAFIQASLCEYAKDDNLIYHGHAGHFLLKGIKHVLKVRIIAELPDRIKAAMERNNLSENEAEKYIERVDRERAKWTKFLYAEDWTSPKLYDIVINSTNLSIENSIDAIVQLVKSTMFQTTPESEKAMNDLLISSRVRAAIARLPLVNLGYLDIRADNGMVTISGRSKSQEISESVLSTAREVNGVKEIKMNVEIDYRSYKIE
jgi:cytidylate kinase